MKRVMTVERRMTGKKIMEAKEQANLGSVLKPQIGLKTQLYPRVK
jgi:hypothetical protein